MFPLGIIDTPSLYFVQPLYGFLLWLCVRRRALLLWFDFDDILLSTVVGLFHFYIEVRKVTMYFVVPRRYIRYDDFFTTPFEDCFAGVAIDHELTFPERTVYDVLGITLIFFRVRWNVSTFVRHDV